MNSDLRSLAALLAIALLVGLIFSELGWALFVAATIFIILQQRQLTAFARWSTKPLSRPLNTRASWQALANTLFQSISRSRRRTHSALRQLQAMRTLSEALPDAAVVINASGNIEQYNDTARALLNLDRADRGANLAALIRQPDFVALIRGRAVDDLVEFASPFADDRRLEARRISFGDHQALILVRDVTQLNRLLSMRQDFIANVSHELRTPLTVIVGYLETLTSENLDPATIQTLVEKLVSPSRRMQALVDDLLLLTRLEASPSPTEEELVAIDMPALIDTVVAEARGISQGKHEIKVDIHRGAKVLGVESELHSACANLVANAVRYSPDGGPIEVSWSPADNAMRFSVRDHGIGIAPEHLTRLTERFYRVDLAKARIRDGTGLGLAIVKHILKRHDSQLQIDSELAAGSTFYYDIPPRQLVAQSHNSAHSD